MTDYLLLSSKCAGCDVVWNDGILLTSDEVDANYEEVRMDYEGEGFLFEGGDVPEDEPCSCCGSMNWLDRITPVGCLRVDS